MAIPQLKTYRRAAKKTQQEAADGVGVDRVTWARWESGANKIDRKLVPAVSELTGIPTRDLRPDLAQLISEAAE